jgi:autotransporter translocation and assembly factor TamB
MARRRVTRWVIGIVSGILLLAATSAIVVETPWFKERLRRIVVSRANEALNAQLSVGSITGSLLTGVEMHDVTLRQAAGPVLTSERISLRYDPRILLRGHLAFTELTLTRPVLTIVERKDGWNIATLTKPSGTSGSTALEFQKLSIVDGDVTVDPASMDARHFAQVNAGLGLSYSADRLKVNINGMSLHDAGTGLALRGTGDLTSDAGQIEARLDLDSSAGAVKGTLSGGHKTQNRDITGHFSVKQLDLAPILARKDLASNITGTVQVHASMPPTAAEASRISFDMDAPAVTAMGYSAQDVKGNGSYTGGVLHLDVAGAAYGAHATAKGEWRSAAVEQAPNTLVLSGQFSGLDVRRVPATLKAPPLDSQLNGRYRFTYQPASWDVALVMDRSRVEGASLAKGTVVHAAMRGGVPEYQLRGHVADLNLRRLSGPLHIVVLNQSRFDSDITGDVDVQGRGSALASMALQASARVDDSTIGPAHLPSANLSASLDRSRLVIDFAGPFEHVNNELIGVAAPPIDLSGRSDGVRLVFADLRAPMTVDTLEADGRATLEQSVLAGYDVDRADIDAALTNGTAKIRELCVDGSELTAVAQGTLALTGSAASNLTFTVDADNLETAATRMGQPITGAAHVDGTITGPPNELTAAGNLALRQFTYGSSFDALTLNGTFGVDVANQQWADMTAHVDTTGTFVKLAGQDIDRLTTNATYHAGSLDLDTKLEQKTRTLELAGGVLIEPEQDELRLRRLALTTANQAWALPDGREAVIQYGGDRVSIKDFVVARGPEQVTINGILNVGEHGASTRAGLDVKAESVQLADLNELAGGTHKLSGVLNVTGRVEGTTTAPIVQSTLTVDNGAIDGTTFQSFNGDVGFRDNKVTLDAKLEAAPGAELTAAGSIPMAIGASAGEPGTGAIDLRVASTPIQLGLFQALTTHVTNIVGTGEFNVHVTGTPRAPQLEGSVNVANAAFAVPPAGTAFANGNARVRFEGNRVLIDQFVIEDDDRHTLTIEGGAEVANARTVQDLNLHAVSDGMHLLRGELGELNLDADLKATGSLGALNLTGDAKVQRGRLEIDALLEQFTSSAYATKPEADIDHPAAGSRSSAAPAAAAPPAATAAPAAVTDGQPAPDTPANQIAQAASGTPYENARINVKLVMPDDMVLRARDLRPSPESIGLGSTNLIVGGTLTLRKAPKRSLGVLGDVQVVRGFYDFQGRRFTIARDSQVQFHGNQPIDPQLNVSATREISGVTTTVALRGTARAPEIQLSSYPPLDESDILSLIVFGQPVNALGESQRVSLAQRAGNLALGAIAGPLAESVGRALNLDLFEIRAEGEGGAPELALGSQIGSHVYIGLRQEFGREDASVVTFEYRFSELLRLVTGLAQGVQQTHSTRRNDPTGVDLMFVIRY